MDGRGRMGSAWKWRYGGRDHFDVFLLLSSLLLIFGSRPGRTGVGTGFYHLRLEVEFPFALNPPKGRPEWYRLIPGCMISYKYICGMIV
jgi:hypothetical protein